MSRADARALAQSTLEALDTFQEVYRSPQRTFQKQSPVAVVLGTSLEIVQEARNLTSTPYGLTASIYMRVPIGDEDDSEDAFDALVEAAAQALHDAGFIVAQSDANVGGAPLREIDGLLYR